MNSTLVPYTANDFAAPGDDARPRSVLDGLNQAQREAVTATEGYVRVIAGAGTGKTRALTHRFAYLVNELGVLPGNILCATFTNKAAAGNASPHPAPDRGQRHRATSTPSTASAWTVLTGGRPRGAVPEELFGAGQFGDIDAMLAMVYEERGLTLRDMTFANARDMIEMLKLHERPDYYLDMLAMPIDDLRRKYDEAQAPKDIIFYGYLYQQKRCFGLDYNDLIVFTLYLFQTHPDVRRKWQERLEYVMVDEFQDIDGIQYQLMEVLAGYHGNLFVVGDPDQTIYTWRGANVRYLSDFDQRFPGTKTVMMLENYRSVPPVIAVVNSLISKNRDRIPKALEPLRADGGPTVWHHAASSADEAA